MRVIRPAALARRGRRRSIILGLCMLAAGLLAAELALAGAGAPLAAQGVMAVIAALGLGVGVAWLHRVVWPRPSAAQLLASLLAPAFDDDYTLILSPQLPIRDGRRLDGLLIGDAGVRALTVRDWDGRYRVRGRVWEFDAGRRRGWIRCRTNPSFDAVTLGEGVARWAGERGIVNVPARGAVAFPLKSSRIVLEEPTDEIITADNAPWWANSIGRVRRLDPATGAALIEAVLDAADVPARARAAAGGPRPRARDAT
jgi:hypothetical protein